jgi:hypothetical protein
VRRREKPAQGHRPTNARLRNRASQLKKHYGDHGNQRDVLHGMRPHCSVGGVSVHIRIQIAVIGMAVAELSDAPYANSYSLNLPTNDGSTSEIQQWLSWRIEDRFGSTLRVLPARLPRQKSLRFLP